MTATTVKPPFADASPAEIRAALLDEERPGFDRQYRGALDAAAESFSLDELHAALRSWRRIAWMTHTDFEAHRRILSTAAHTLSTGERPAGERVVEPGQGRAWPVSRRTAPVWGWGQVWESWVEEARPGVSYGWVMASAMTEESRTVFISYRRTVSWATTRLVFRDLTNHGFDVFMDVENIDSGEFGRVILSQIATRAHFIVILEQGSLDRIADDGDWLRREIAQAIASKRNIVPLTCNGFSLRRLDVALPADIASLTSFNEVPVPHEYFDEAMRKLRERFLWLSKPTSRTGSEIALEVLKLIQMGKADDQIAEAYGGHRKLEIIKSYIPATTLEKAEAHRLRIRRLDAW